MNEQLPDVWATRDLPVLRAVVAYFEEHGRGPRVDDLERALPDMSPDHIQRAGQNLARDGLIDTQGAMGKPVLMVTNISSRALRETGAWPSPGTAYDRMLSALEELATNSGDEDTRGRARRLLDATKSAGGQIGVAVAAAMITGQLPGQ